MLKVSCVWLQGSFDRKWCYWHHVPEPGQDCLFWWRDRRYLKLLSENSSIVVHTFLPLIIVPLCEPNNILQLKTSVTLMCLFILTSKWSLKFPFSPGIEEHAGTGEPSFEGSTVLFFRPVLHEMLRLKHVMHAFWLNESHSVCTLLIKLCCSLFWHQQ